MTSAPSQSKRCRTEGSQPLSHPEKWNNRAIEPKVRNLHALLKLADTYSAARLEGACEKALCYRCYPNFRSINTILKTGSDKRIKETGSEPLEKQEKDTHQYAFTRGKDYYGGNDNGN